MQIIYFIFLIILCSIGKVTKTEGILLLTGMFLVILLEDILEELRKTK